VEHRKLRAIRPFMLMPKGTIYFSEIYSDEANLYTNSIKSPIGKKHVLSRLGHPIASKGFRPSGPNVLLCFDGLDLRFD
jgi:hypothetical protein